MKMSLNTYFFNKPIEQYELVFDNKTWIIHDFIFPTINYLNSLNNFGSLENKIDITDTILKVIEEHRIVIEQEKLIEIVELVFIISYISFDGFGDEDYLEEKLKIIKNQEQFDTLFVILDFLQVNTCLGFLKIKCKCNF